MKKLSLLLALCAFSAFAAEVNLIPDADGKEKFKNWYNPASAQITAADGIITITANPDPKVNHYQKAQALIKLKGNGTARRYSLCVGGRKRLQEDQGGLDEDFNRC